MVVYMERDFLLCVGGSFVEFHVLCFMTKRADESWYISRAIQIIAMLRYYQHAHLLLYVEIKGKP